MSESDNKNLNFNSSSEASKPSRTLLDEWRERQYGAFVNFLRKKSESMYDDWRKFKSGKRKATINDESKLMNEFLIMKERERK